MHIDQQRDSKLLKFLKLDRERRNRAEKRCFPEQMIGVSAESPNQFQQQHTLINPHGYVYIHDEKHTAGAKQTVPFSQRKFFTIDHHDNLKPFTIEISKAFATNPLVFHRQKGLLSEYMDKNDWMSKVHKLMGHERSATSRGLSNKQRSLRINSLKKSPNSVAFQQTPILGKQVDRKYFETIPVLMGEKMRIRRSRIRFASQIQQKRVQAQCDNSLKFHVDNFEKRELSQEMSKRVQTSRIYYDKLSARATTADFKLTNGFRSTMAETFRPRQSSNLGDMIEKSPKRESDLLIDEQSPEQDELRFYRTQKIIPRKKMSAYN